MPRAIVPLALGVLAAGAAAGAVLAGADTPPDLGTAPAVTVPAEPPRKAERPRVPEPTWPPPKLSRRTPLVDVELPAVPPGSDAVVPVKRVGALVRRRTVMRRRPAGKAVTTIGRRTNFGSRQLLTVVGHRPGWVGVLHPDMPNGASGWVPRDAVRTVHSGWELALDRSARQLRVRWEGRLVARHTVSVGRPETPTPVARYGITDRLTTEGPGSPYGCCILALSGRQKDLPQSWSGGDRLALHGTPTDVVGQAASTGCVRIASRDLRWLMRRIPIGTRVDVVA